MRAPDFWGPNGGGGPLRPLGALYGLATRLRLSVFRRWRAPVPVICVGNLVAGGGGKTPAVLSLAERLRQRGANPHLLSRGYGGREPGPLRVDAQHHQADAVGDEPLLLARTAPTWVSRDRAAGAAAAVAAGAGCLIMDDGLQNPALVHDISLVMVDGDYGFGNRGLIPAGPLRESLAAGLARADAAVIVGPDRHGAADLIARIRAGLPVLTARVEPEAAPDLAAMPVVAFAGIARPQRFFASLESLGCVIAARHACPDHHPYTEAELEAIAMSGPPDAVLVTTAKDAARLPPPWRARVQVLPVTLRWDDDAALDAVLAPVTAACGGVDR